MARRPIRVSDIENPHRIVSSMISDYIGGALDNNNWLYRAVVINVDELGGNLESDPPNPKNSIRARITSYRN